MDDEKNRKRPRKSGVKNPLYGKFDEMVRAVLRPVKRKPRMKPDQPKPIKRTAGKTPKKTHR